MCHPRPAPLQELQHMVAETRRDPDNAFWGSSAWLWGMDKYLQASVRA